MSINYAISVNPINLIQFNSFPLSDIGYAILKALLTKLKTTHTLYSIGQYWKTVKYALNCVSYICISHVNVL